MVKQAPIHLSRGNEDQLTETFSYIKPTDYAFPNWRAIITPLLHGYLKENKK